ncbi:hypothetical protein FZI85_08375 [Mycobacterium sp. CBMA293]|uniref:hypothetical protein n=2 Tax=Mycolicibacterium TaxID=1866885 RepID=UPI0012DE5CF6|nr:MULTISPECIES: hypothetical protein [unclassified Mycolicibacterium]MUL46386.1 hypothetical protein [Mycolicibacterium sp. CBMA 360]MUL57101.1 hypothetical protein [Mycolicibacterium sp. CBMA 335]MUL70141.1 hypothetical protein [Mycolicibacterium sp. CBMA 311]MUL92189.1 hypothetical protein [Mycolicibacterium sp. CBMA 230]MUM05929.1 hypothetical protein [Mycolicibacterium sp. CBMA 213]
MLLSPRLPAALAAAAVIAPLTAVAPAAEHSSPPTVSREIRLAAAVPPGGLITSFINNQGIYCSIICPLLAQTVTTGVSTTLQEPGVFFAALPANGLLKAIGIAGASMTGPTAAAMDAAIAADSAIPAKRALNAFEVGVVGLMNIPPAILGGPAAVLNAFQQFRQQTFDALNAPVVPNPTPTVMPHGVLQVAVIGAINVVAAVIFPAFNDVLAGAFHVPDAVSQELAKTGNPLLAVMAGIQTAAGVVTAAGTVIANTIVTELNNVRTAAMQPGAFAPLAASKPVTAASTVNPVVPTVRTPLQQPKIFAPLASIGTPKTPTTPLPVLQSGGRFHDPLSGLTTGLTNILAPKSTSGIKPGTQSNDRGSQAGLPSRPALRASR